MAKRFVMRVELSPGSRGKVGLLSKRYGMTQLAVVSRLVDWFATQDEAVQAACLDLYPQPHRADIAKLILSRMGRETSRRS